MVLALLLAVLVWLQVFQVWQLALILALARICVTFELPSRQVFFFDLVGPEILSNAIALNSGLFNATRVVGPALAGVGLSLVGAAGCFALNGVSYLAAIAAILSIRLARASAATWSRSLHHQRDLLGGLGYLRNDRRIFAQFALVAFFGFVGMGYEAMVPAYARRVVETGVYGYSVLLACERDRRDRRAHSSLPRSAGCMRKERLTIAGMVMFGGCLAGAALLPSFFPPASTGSARLVAAAVCLLGAGFGAVLFYSSSMTLIQLAAPDHLRGRVMGIWMIVYSGSVPLGALWTGTGGAVVGRLVCDGVLGRVSAWSSGLVVWASGVLAPMRHVRASD